MAKRGNPTGESLERRQESTRRQFLKASGIVGLGVAGFTGGEDFVLSPDAALDHATDALMPAVDPGQSSSGIFSPQAQWIWDGSDRWGYHHYMEARRTFEMSEADGLRIAEGGSATLTIAADAYYQAWLNGKMIGHGPAKSAEGRRSVDTWPIADLLLPRTNELRVLVLSLGVGTMTYCPAEPGLIFELNLTGRVIASDESTEVRPDPARQKRTARRWVLPCIEDVDANAQSGGWKPATQVEKKIELYPRRVPLPTRDVLLPKRMIAAETVRLPNVSVSFRIKPYLTDGEAKRRWNRYDTPAYIITDIVSPIEQPLVLTPTLGNVTWYLRGEKLYEGSGWSVRGEKDPPVRLQLQRGANRLIGVHSRENHFEDINLAGFAEQPVEFRNPFGKGAFQVLRVQRAADLAEGPAMERLDWLALKPQMPEMDPADSMPFGNCYDLVYGAEFVERDDSWRGAAMATPASAAIEIPASRAGEANRVIVDLGVIHHGWLAFDAEGHAGSSIILAMFEAIDPGPPRRIQWPDGFHNALAYHLQDGRQAFESFFTYGVRYIAIHHQGSKTVRIRNLRVLTANCGSILRGSLATDDEMLNAIYRICAQSVISGVDDTFMDCPTYEQVNWNFDNRTAWLAESLACANYPVAENSIELFAEDPRYPGLVRDQYPSTWDSQIPLWSFSWLIWCRDYYWNTANKEFAQRIMPRVAAGVEDGLSKIGAKGLLEWSNTWHLVEWAYGRDDDHAISSTEQAAFAEALGASADLAELVGGAFARRAALWRAARESLIRAINTQLWDPKRHAYFDSLHEDGAASPVTSVATNAAMVAYGIASPERSRELARRILAKDSEMLPIGSPFGLYYVFEMFDRLGDVESIFKLVRERYGAMVLAGDTSTWETFAEFGHGDWPTRSRCHPFAAYVAKYMVKYLLGLENLAPGFARFQVRPNPPAGVASCHGAVPTPKGLIHVGWEKRDGRIRVDVTRPSGLERVSVTP